MKQVLVVLALFFSAGLCADQVRTLTVTTQELAANYGWADLYCPRNFDLNAVLSVAVDSAGTMKYTKNTKQMHCYQWLGGFTINAKQGCQIRKVKLTYFSVYSGVMTMNWGADGKQIAEQDRIASGQVVVVNGSSVKFYVGTTGTNTDGQIRLEQWEVEYTMPKTNDMMMRTATDLGKQNGWADATCPVNITFNNALSLHSDQNNNVKYYSTTGSFHCYQWCGGFYIKARRGTKIQSVELIYESLNDGVLIQNWGSNGKNIPEDDWIASGAIVPVNGDSVHFYTGNKHETSNCQIHLTDFTVVYVDSLAFVESFESCTSSGSEQAVSVAGDKGYYNWQLRGFQRKDEDVTGINQGTRLSYNGAIATDGIQEGGVKDVSFDWRAGDDTKPVHFMVQAGETADNFQRANPGASSYVMNYTKEMAVKKNCAFSVSLGAQDATAQTCPVVGPITITPYLLFKLPNRADTLDTNLDAYDLKAVLINNTDEVPVFEILSNTTGDAVKITNGVMDLSQVLHGGVVRVKASCCGGDVFTTMTVVLQMVPRVAFAETNKVVNISDAPFVNPLLTPDSLGSITYTSSDPKVATVNDTGLVSITGLGQTVITAHVAAGETYMATAASFNLSVIYTPEEGTYREETFSQCRMKKLTEGFAYVSGDDAVYDWNLSNFSRDQQDTISGMQGILLGYGGSIASNGVQEGGIKYLSFDWRAVDGVLPVHFFVNITDTSWSYSSAAVGDPDMVLTYCLMPAIRCNTTLSIQVRAKENPAQSRMVVSPVTLVPYLLFTNKYVEVELPQTSYDCATDLIDNTEGADSVVYSIVSSTCDTVAMEGSVLDLRATTTAGDIQVQATWGAVSTTMTVHVTVPSSLPTTLYPSAPCTKVVKDGELLIHKNGQHYSVLGIPRKP